MYKFDKCENCQCSICNKFGRQCNGNCKDCETKGFPICYIRKDLCFCVDFEKNLSIKELLIQINTTLNFCAEQLTELIQILKRI